MPRYKSHAFLMLDSPFDTDVLLHHRNGNIVQNLNFKTQKGNMEISANFMGSANLVLSNMTT